MYIIKNAFKSITRNKARNILIGIVALVIAVSACVSLSIRQAAETAKASTLAGLSITAQISFDRSSAMSEMKKDMESSDSGSGQQSTSETSKKKFDFSSLQGEELTLDDYMKYTEALTSKDSYYYTATTSLNASGDLEAYSSSDTSTADSTTTTQNSSSSQQSQMGMPNQGGDMAGGGKDFNFSAQGDFSLNGYSSYTAMMSLFGEDGTYSISSGEMFDTDSSNLKCIISDELAMYNDLSVGDTITLANPNYEKETYTLTISGIYTNSASDEGNNVFSRSDPANDIYMSYNALMTIIDKSASLDNKVTEDSGETDAKLTSRTNFTYVFANVENYNSFKDKVYDLGLSDKYTVTSTDLSTFESSLTPLETLSSMAGWFFLVVLLVGGIILIVLNIFNLRERKYEVGVLTAIGMKKHKVAIQFVCEVFAITFIAIIIGAAVGAAISVPVTNTLLANQIESSQNSNNTLNDKFGFDKSNSNGGPSFGGGQAGGQTAAPGNTQNVSYINSVSSATNIFVILELIGVGIFLTIISSLGAMITIMRYEPLKILSSRS